MIFSPNLTLCLSYLIDFCIKLIDILFFSKELIFPRINKTTYTYKKAENVAGEWL